MNNKFSNALSLSLCSKVESPYHPFNATLLYMRFMHSMQFLLQVTHNVLYATGFFILNSCCGKIISNFGKNRKSNCDFKTIHGINYIFMNLHDINDIFFLANV